MSSFSQLSGGRSVPDLAAQQGFGSLMQVLAKVRVLEESLGNIPALEEEVDSLLSYAPDPITTAPTNDQMVTWRTLKTFLDLIFPVGCMQMTSGAAPNTYNGYMVWTLYSTGDGRYLKCYGGGSGGGAAAGTLVSQQNLTHTHTVSPIVVPAQTVTSGNNTTFTATTTFSALTPVASASRNAVGTNAAVAQTNNTGLVFTAHTHQVTIPSQNIVGTSTAASGGATLECNAIFVAIYIRTS